MHHPNKPPSEQTMGRCSAMNDLHRLDADQSKICKRASLEPSPKSDYSCPTINSAGELGICQIADLFIALTGRGSQYHINCTRLNSPVCIHPAFPPTFKALFPLWS